MSDNQDKYSNTILDRGFRARLEAMTLAHDKAERLRMNQTATALKLLQAGITLMPCEHLHDNEFLVSTAVHEAAKKLVIECHDI